MSSKRPSRPPDSFPEKRSFLRYPRWFPVTLVPSTGPTPNDTPQGAPVWAICRDASAGGLQLSSVMPFVVGTTVTARFRVSRGGAEHVVAAAVVRAETNDDELMLAFPFRLGLRFLSPLHELPDELARPLAADDPAAPWEPTDA